MPDLNPEQFDVRYHLTDNPRFAPDPSIHPQDNSLSLRNMHEMPAGMFVTQHPEGWVNGHNYVRPFVAEVHVPKGVGGAERFGNEDFIPAEHYDKIKVNRVIPLDAHAREEYNDHGWIETHHGTTFDTGKPVPDWPHSRLPGYKYDGPDARDMPAREVQQHYKRWSGYMQGNRGWSREDAQAIIPRKIGPRRKPPTP